MKKWLIAAGTGVIVLVVGGVVLMTRSSATPAPASRTAQTSKTSARKRKPAATPRLTLAELKHNRKLTYSCIIYYAIKDTKLPRWQEVNDSSVGWQVEHYAKKHPTRYLVWPDRHITDADKNLAPNWFTLSADKVTYDSMIVHSFRKDQTAATTLTHIVTQINADHAMKKVRTMPAKMMVLNHAK